jgi:hypothetical protein
MWKNAAIQGVLKPWKLFLYVPVSLVSSKGSKAGKILRKGMHLMMLKGTLDTARWDGMGSIWIKKLGKWISCRWLLWLSLWLGLLEAPLPIGTLHEKALL